jgi:hypothetical protein
VSVIDGRDAAFVMQFVHADGSPVEEMGHPKAIVTVPWVEKERWYYSGRSAVSQRIPPPLAKPPRNACFPSENAANRGERAPTTLAAGGGLPRFLMAGDFSPALRYHHR